MEELMTTNIYKIKDIVKEKDAEEKEVKLEIEEKAINEEIDKIFNWKYEDKELTKIEGKVL